MKTEELRFHIGGLLSCPQRYEKGELEGEMDYEATVYAIMEFAEEWAETGLASLRTKFVNDLKLLKGIDGFNKRFGLSDLGKTIDNLITAYQKRLVIPKAFQEKPEPSEGARMYESESFRMAESQFLAREKWRKASFWNRVKWFTGLWIPDFTRGGR